MLVFLYQAEIGARKVAHECCAGLTLAPDSADVTIRPAERSFSVVRPARGEGADHMVSGESQRRLDITGVLQWC